MTKRTYTDTERLDWLYNQLPFSEHFPFDRWATRHALGGDEHEMREGIDYHLYREECERKRGEAP